MALEVSDAIAAVQSGDDPGALFLPNIIWRLEQLREKAPDKYQRLRADIKALGPDVVKELDRVLRREEAQRRAEAKELGLEQKRGTTRIHIAAAVNT
jgi:hypothetical protein